ncbi:MAG: hypothetical protein V7K40_22480 [Nostoc sp.]|uniref:hypothetical protein n=1 Tax=Nostoc sp. TaxID=1180 RepID=UPI002FFC84FA
MKKLPLILFAGSTFVSSLLLNLFLEKSAKADNPNQQKLPEKISTNNAHTATLNCQPQNCSGNAHLATFNPLFMAKADNLQPDNQKVIELNMTDEESDAAIAKFGCDCPKAINALRQTRGITIGVEGEYLPPTEKITPCTDKNTQSDSQSTTFQ